jgi:Raf kinase inhibitor-like YbhB/YbcL family protein
MGLNIHELRITSPDFAHCGPLGQGHSHQGGDIPPSLCVRGVPSAAVELVIICHDPDAPLPEGFTHWTLYGLPPVDVDLGPDAGIVFRSGPNDTGASGYFGPAPPPGHGLHHYYFWVYALDAPVRGTPSRAEFLTRYRGHIIEQNRVVGVYGEA